MSELSVITNRSFFNNPFTSYWTDALQRSILFLDVMRRSGAQYEEQRPLAAHHTCWTMMQSSSAMGAALSGGRSITGWFGSFRQQGWRSIRTNVHLSSSIRGPAMDLA